MKILFVQPDSKNNIINKAVHIHNFEPLGLYYLASTVRQNHDVELLDLNIELHIKTNPDINIFEKTILNFKPDVVAFSALASVRSGRINELCGVTKILSNNIITVVGGIHATLVSEDFSINPNIDIVIKNNQIKNFEKLISLIDLNIDLKTIKQHLSNSKITKLKGQNFSNWISPFRQIGNKYKRYYQIAIGSPGITNIHESISSLKTSSGCPFRCNFCCLCELYPKYEKRKIGSIISEIHSINDDFIFFADDESLIDSNYMYTLAEEIIKAGSLKKIIMYARADSIEKNRRVLEKLKIAGLYEVWIGLESVSNQRLKNYNKQNDTNSHENAMKICNALDIHVHASVLVDNSFTKEDFNKTFDYTKEHLKLSSCHFFILTPFRGTRYYNDLCINKPNLFLTHDSDHYSARQLVLQPENMAVDEFLYLYYELQKKYNSDKIPFSYNDDFIKKEYKEELDLEIKHNNELFQHIRESGRTYNGSSN